LEAAVKRLPALTRVHSRNPCRSGVSSPRRRCPDRCRYERRSVIVTSNIHPSGFDSITPKTLATAGVDRLLHHPRIVLTEGASLRLAQATNGPGVVPLAPTG
jgi:hypothetical protein